MNINVVNSYLACLHSRNVFGCVARLVACIDRSFHFAPSDTDYTLEAESLFNLIPTISCGKFHLFTCFIIT